MRETFRLSMAWLHTWGGVVTGWLLFAIFFTGTLSYLRHEMTAYMQPEISAAERVAVQQQPVPELAQTAQRALQARAAGAHQWVITLPGQRQTETLVFTLDPDSGVAGYQRDSLDPLTGALSGARQTYGGETFFRFHYSLLLPSLWGRVVVGLLATAMAVGLVTGVVMHRRIFRDLMTFRPVGGVRSWLDGHVLCGVFALPYHVVMTYSGLVTLLILLMPWGVMVRYGGDMDHFAEEVGFSAPHREETDRPGQIADLGPMVTQAMDQWNGGTPERIVIDHPADESAQVSMIRSAEEQIPYRDQWITFDGRTGQILAQGGPEGAFAHTSSVLYGLHLGRFASAGQRALAFVAGLLGSGMIASGMVLWAVKKRQKAKGRPLSKGVIVIERGNVGVMVGLVVAVVALLCANRLLPTDWVGRAAGEVQVFFAVWGLSILWAAVRPPRSALRGLLIVGGALYAACPLLTALLTPRGLIPSLIHRDLVFAGIDLICLALAAIGWMLAWVIKRGRRGKDVSLGKTVEATQ